MIYYLLLPFFSILLIALQNTVADVIFSGRLVLEISIIVLVYAGFRFSLVKGAISAFVLGFMYDCISGTLVGLFTLIYILIFLFSFLVSTRLITERMPFIAIFTLFCTFFEELIVVLFYNLAYGFNVLYTPVVFLPQAIIIGLLAPGFFYMMRRVEVFFYGKPVQSAQWTGTGRIPAKN